VERWRSEHKPDGGQRLGKGDAQARRRRHYDGYEFTDGQKILRLQKIVMASGKEMLLYGR
jgi:hypothetical protein